MDPILFQFGALLAAFTLVMYTIVSFLTGAAFANGAVVRESIEPTLKRFRESSPKERAGLADASVVTAVAIALVSLLVEQSMGAAVFAGVLWWSRPRIRKLTSSEHVLMSLGSQFSADLVIGIVVPLALAHMLMGNPILALAHGAVVVALCWPAGGPGRSSGEWRPAWVAG